MGSKYGWDIFPEEFPVPLGDYPGAVNPDCVAVVGSNLNYNPSFAPLFRVVAMLVLDVDMVTREKWREVPGALCHPFLCSGSGFGEGFFPGFGGNSLFLSGEELAWLENERTPYLSPEYYLGWTEDYIWGGSVPLCEDGLNEVISIKGACL